MVDCTLSIHSKQVGDTNIGQGRLAKSFRVAEEIATSGSFMLLPLVPLC